MAHPAQRLIEANRRAMAKGGGEQGSVCGPSQDEATRYGLINRPGRPGAPSTRGMEDAYQIQRAKERERDNWGMER